MSDGINKGEVIIAKQNIRASELDDSHGTKAAVAPMHIMTDGTPEGTIFMIGEQVVEFSSLCVDCFKEGDYPGCSISLTVKDIDENGIEVHRSMTLRKESSK